MRSKCIKCGAECCTCTGCNPSAYVNGLCPNCHEKAKAEAAAKISTPNA